MRFRTLPLFCAAILAGCDRSSPKSASPASQMAKEESRNFSVDMEPIAQGRRIRVVWAQSSSDGAADISAQGNELLLMGLDSDDRQGIRQLSSAKRNFFRPLISSDGSKVIFTDRAAGPHIFSIPWGEETITDLGEGVAVAVWKDPASEVEWIYALEQIDAGAKGSLIGKRLVRFVAATPDEREIVWGQTPMDADGFALSRDGIYASALLPSPEASRVNLSQGSWKKLATATWPGMAPDNSYVSWTLDAERAVLQFNQMNQQEPWEINLSAAPGLGGNAKIWHPRWCGGVGILAFTGPYPQAPNQPNFIDLKDGTGAEIFLASIGAGSNAIVSTVQLTHNNRGDCYPDVWMEGPQIETLAGFEQSPEERPDAIPKPWPANPEAVHFAWNSGAKDVELPASDGTRVSRVFGKNFAKLDRFWNLDFSRGYFEADSASSSGLAAAVNGSHEFTVEAILTETRDGIDPLSIRLLGYRQKEGGEMFGLYRLEGNLVLRIRLGALAESSAVFPIKLASFRIDPDRPYHLTITISGKTLKTYIDSSLVSEDTLDEPGLGGWMEGVFQIGDPNPMGSAQWTGQAESVATYGRALSQEEVLKNFDAAKQKMAVRKSADRIKVKAKLEEITELPANAIQGPYPRVLTSRSYKLEEVLAGICEHKFFTVNHDAVLNQNVVKGLPGKIGDIYELVLEPAGQHPELKAARVENTSSHVDLPVFVDVTPRP